MAVLVDTPIWSLAFRRRPADLNAEEAAHRLQLGILIEEGLARMIGPVRQEVLTGIRDPAVFRRIQGSLRSFPDELLSAEDYEEAAIGSNHCIAAGLAGSPVDLLICAVALRRNWEIFTLDRDFERYAKVVKVRLYQPRHAN